MVLQESWRRKGHGLNLKMAQAGKDCEKVTHCKFTDNCYWVSSSRKDLREMMMESTVELRRRGLDWRKEEMEFRAWRDAKGRDG